MPCRSSKLLIALAIAVLLSCGQAPPEKPQPATTSEAPPPAPEITHFYASPASVAAGDPAQFCYGVLFADAVAIDPDVKELKPGSNRCFSVTPKSDTVYTLTATGPGGSANAQLAVEVRARAAAATKSSNDEPTIITTFLASPSRAAKGSRITICYALEGADSVSLDPPVIELEPVSRCFTHVIEQSTTFTLTATGSGRTETRSLVVSVY